MRQALQMFFTTFILYSEQRCQVVLQALVRIAYSILNSKYINSDNKNKKKAKKIKPRVNQKKEKMRKSVGSSSEWDDDESSEMDEEEEEHYTTLEEVCSGLDIIHISKVFMILLSEKNLTENAPKGMKLKTSLNAEFLINLCYMNNEIFKRVQIVKEVINSVVEFINLKEVQNLSILKLLREQVDKCNKKVLQGLPKLNKFLTLIDARIEEVNNLQIEGID